MSNEPTDWRDLVPEREPRRISDREELEPRTRELCTALLERADAAGVPAILIETVRYEGRQAWLYAAGRTREGRKVTNAKPGETWHDPASRRAFDVVLIDAAGRAWWDAPAERWDKLGAIGKGLGLTWGGDFPGLRDAGHFQLDRVTLAEAKSIIDAYRVKAVRAELIIADQRALALARELTELREILEGLVDFVGAPADNEELET